MKRAIRRHHKNRMKAKARKVGKLWNNPYAEYHADNLCMCSCHGCGNPRKWFKEKTKREIEADIHLREEKHELV